MPGRYDRYSYKQGRERSIGMLNSRAAAHKQGESHYFTNKPCKYGHISKRYTASGNCVECFNTVHRQARSECQSTKRCKKKWSQEVNKKTNDKAKNSRQSWTLKDLKIALAKDEKGQYLKTQQEVAYLLHRSHRSVNNIRWKYKEN